MRLSTFIFLVLWLSSLATAYAQILFEYRELASCSREGNPYRYDGSLQSRRAASHQILIATVPLNCASRPKVTVQDGTPIYVNIEDVFPDEMRAVCNCMRRFEITLKSPIPPGSTIWVLANGRGIARALAQ